MKITVFTPTYNRSDKLSRVYESLKKQTSFDFEWLIVDDGSTDNTKNTVLNFCNETDFSVRYIYQENGGKHRAYNTALKAANGEYFFCLDSDDRLQNNAIEKIVSFTEELKENEWIAAYKSDESGKLLSDKFPDEINEAIRFSEFTKKYNCKGEFSLIFPLESARKFPFPTFDGENFITESVIYDRIDKVSKARLLREIITVCEYQNDGLSNNLNKIMKSNPAGYCLYFMQRIDMQDNFKDRIITAGKYNCFKIFAGKKACKYTGNYQKQVVLSKIPGYIFWLYYKIIRHF